MTRKSTKAKPMNPDEIKALRQAKEKQDLGNYLTLLTWLDETPTRFGGVPIRHIPDEAFWPCS